jgi:maltose alpha-D-glucosyltransferase/alpha-amylase
MQPPVLAFDHFDLDLPSLAKLLPAVLPAFLSDQRWFGAKSCTIRNVLVTTVIQIPDPNLVAAHVLVNVQFANETSHDYHLLLGLKDPQSVPSPGVLASVRLPDRTLCVCDMLRSPQDCEPLLHALHSLLVSGSYHPNIQIECSDALAALRPPFHAHPIDGEQSNSSVIFGGVAVMKVFRRTQPGIHPDVEVSSFLSAAGFVHTPRYLGSITYVASEGERRTLASIQQFVANQGDGWNFATRAVRTYLDCPSSDQLEVDARTARELGITTALLHIALASANETADFAPVPVEPSDLVRWQHASLARLQKTAALVRDPPILATFSAVRALLEAPLLLLDPGKKQRVHGDYHLGQVLRANDQWVILDFEGEPARTLEERREKHSPLRDVAGMLRSFSYVAFAALLERASPDSESWNDSQPAALDWEEAARSAFFDGWSDTLRGTALIPLDPNSLAALLDALELDKAIYEFAYELDHRPAWLTIPLHGMNRIISRRRV